MPNMIAALLDKVVFNAAKFGSGPLLDYRAVTLPLGDRKTWMTQSEYCTW